MYTSLQKRINGCRVLLGKSHQGQKKKQGIKGLLVLLAPGSLLSVQWQIRTILLCPALHGLDRGPRAVSLVPKNYGMTRIHLDGFSAKIWCRDKDFGGEAARERKRVQSWGSFSCQEKSKMTARNHWCSLSIVSCQLCLWFFFRDKLFFQIKV